MEESVQQIIEALGNFETPLNQLWEHAMKANYAHVVIDFAWFIGLVAGMFIATRAIPKPDDDYDNTLVVALKVIIYIMGSLIAGGMLTFAIYRLIAPEMAVIDDILNMVT